MLRAASAENIPRLARGRLHADAPPGSESRVAWGLPYLRRLAPGPALHHPAVGQAPVMPASGTRGPAPERPRGRRCSRGTHRDPAPQRSLAPYIDDAADRLRGKRRLLHLTSLRRGSAGRRALEGGDSLPLADGDRRGRPRKGSHSRGRGDVPPGSPLPCKGAVGPGEIANFEDPRLCRPARQQLLPRGTHLHLSHVAYEDLDAWYVNFAFDEAGDDGAFKPGLPTSLAGTQVVPQGPE